MGYMEKTKPILKYWGPPVVWAVLIFLLSAWPLPLSSQIYWKDFLLKKTAHLIEYAILAILLYRGFINKGCKKNMAGVYSLLLAVFYAITDEVHQAFTPGREPRMRDVVIDGAGIALALYSVEVLLPKGPDKVKYWAKWLELI